MFTHVGSGRLELSVRPPLIYLDHCAVRLISSDAAKRDHLIKTFESRGTLMFSVMNMLEMARNSGDSYERIRDFLDQLGPYWLLSDFDPARVEAKESRGELAPASFFVPLAIFGHVFRELPSGTFRLGTALERLHDADFRERGPSVLNRAGLLGKLQELRASYRAGEKFLPVTAPKHTLSWIQARLVRLLVSDGKKITENDVVDLLHAIVALRYAVVLVFDSAWASLTQRLPLPEGSFVFAAKDAALNSALECIRTIDTSMHQVVRPATPQFIRD